MELSIIVPTYNENDNVELLVNKLRKALNGVDWEVIFVDDDSSDGTANLIKSIAKENKKVRILHRIGRRGLSSACVEGMLSSSASYLAVIDGDLQHDETILPEMLHYLKNEDLDIVVGSRYVNGGGIGNWECSRLKKSQLATKLSKVIVPSELKDPMSGFFMIKRDSFEKSVRNLSLIGFKILVDLFASSPKPFKFREVPYHFRSRQNGKSKLDATVMWDYLLLLIDKLIGKWIPVHFISFTIIGGGGIILHLSIFTVFFHLLHNSFIMSQSIATMIAMVSNYALNNILTYRDQKLTGFAWMIGLVSFSIVCSVGAFANVGVASYMFKEDAGWALSALVGIVVGAVWNYAMTRVFTWHKVQRQ
jgi:dolichol-phosphate mannosyltransferase